MNDNLQVLIEKLVYKTTEEDGWAPQNKLGQYLARMGRSVRELGYEKMSSFFLDHPERFEVEKDVHGLPVVRLIGEPPANAADVLDNINSFHQPQPQQRGFHNNNYNRGNFTDYGRQPYNNGYQRGNFYQPYPAQYNGYRDRRPSHFGYQPQQEQLSLFRWAFFPEREEWLQMLADLASEHVWHYDGSDPEHPNTALFDYLRDTFRRLQLEGKVLESRAEGIALFNTGLVDREEGRAIYAVFGPNPNRNRQPWLFQEFFLSSAQPRTSRQQEPEEQQPVANDEEYAQDDNYDIDSLESEQEPPYFTE